MPLIRHPLRPPLNEVFLSPGFLRALDRASANRREWPDEGVQELFRILRKAGNLAKVCARFGLFADEAEERHVREDWFGEGGKGWWPKEPMEALFRNGMIRAIELLREHDLPLASYWRIGKDTRRAQITFAISTHQITLVISTPPPRVRRAGGQSVANRRVWFVAHDGRNKVVSIPGRMPARDDEPHIPRAPCRRR
jgi:hypothetical protein